MARRDREITPYSARAWPSTGLDISGPRTVQFSTMAARATWKGFLKISLVNIPIKVFPATESSGTISFHQLHGESSFSQ
jgi:hypothetical protein